MFRNISIKSKLITLLLLATLIITTIVSTSFGMLLNYVFYKDAQAKITNAVVYFAGHARNMKQNLMDSTPFVMYNLNIDSKLKTIYDNPLHMSKTIRKDIALKLLTQLKYSFADEIYIYDANNELLAYAINDKYTYICGYQLKNKDIYTKSEKEDKFTKAKIKSHLPEHIYIHKDPFSRFTTTGQYRIFNQKINIIAHREFAIENKAIGSITMVDNVNQEHIDILLKNLDIDMQLIINDKGIKDFKKKYQIDLKSDNIYIPPLFSDIRNNLYLIDKEDEFLSVVAIQAGDDHIYVTNSIKKDLLDEAVLENRKLFYMSISLFSLFLVAMSIYVVNKIIGRPLSSLLKNINRIEEGNYNLNNIKYNDDEIGKISNTVYSMAKTIEYREKVLDDMVKEEVEKNRQKDKQLFQQSRLAQIGEMISMIAHQWRQPLAAISATSIDLQMKIEFGTYDSKNQEQVEDFYSYTKNSLIEIDSFVENLTTTIDDFRNFYKPNKKAAYIEFEEVMKQSMNIIKGSLNSHGIKVIYDYKSIIKLKLHKNEMVQVVLNVLKNAQDNLIEKKIKEPKIEITVDENKIIICDNGGGIDKDIIDNIFDPYFSTKDDKNGTGIGLYMSKTIVHDHHNGDLSVENKDGGACFIIEVGNID